MTRRFTGAAACPLLLLIAACASQSDALPAGTGSAAPPPASGITAEDVRARVAFLASDELRGRDTPSPGLEAAAEYLADEYRRLGLLPGAEDGTYFQRFPYDLSRLDPEGSSLRISSADGAADLVYGRDYFAVQGMQAPLEGPLVFLGMGASPPAAGELRDQIAVYAVPGGNVAEVNRYTADQLVQATGAGARGVIHVFEERFPARILEAAARQGTTPRRQVGRDAGMPSLFLSYAAAADVFRRADLDLGALWREARSREFRPVTLPGVELRANVRREVIDAADPPNVVAVLPGSDPELRDEYVVLSAHLDGLGVGRPINGDSIYNGADDNASGNAALVEVAEELASRPERPRRSIIFLHVSGEEDGLLGSEWYSEHPTVPLRSIVANINVDMIGRNAPDTIVVIGMDYSSLGENVRTVARRNPQLGLTLSPDKWPEERFFFRSDHFNFARKEIPALFVFSGAHEDYHRPSDELEKLDVDKVARVARMILHTTTAIANAPERPEWEPEGLREVRAMTER